MVSSLFIYVSFDIVFSVIDVKIIASNWSSTVLKCAVVPMRVRILNFQQRNFEFSVSVSMFVHQMLFFSHFSSGVMVSEPILFLFFHLILTYQLSITHITRHYKHSTTKWKIASLKFCCPFFCLCLQNLHTLFLFFVFVICRNMFCMCQ